VVEVRDYLALGAGLEELEVGLTGSVLAEEAEEDGIGDGGLAYPIAASDGVDIGGEGKLLVTEALEVGEFEVGDTNVHFTDSL
jgi:hypothetical protein